MKPKAPSGRSVQGWVALRVRARIETSATGIERVLHGVALRVRARIETDITGAIKRMADVALRVRARIETRKYCPRLLDGFVALPISQRPGCPPREGTN